MKKIEDYIKKNRSSFILKENQPDDLISNIENQLSFKFDNHYKEYLKKFGLICFESMETFGVGVKDTSHLSVVKNTQEVKNEEGFPDNSVVLEYIGEANYIIYTMNKGVFQYSSNSLSLIKNNLEEYLLMRFDEVTSL